MKLDDFNSLERNKSNVTKDNFLTTFMKELQNTISNFIKNPPSFVSSNLSRNSIYVVRDINDEQLSLVNINDGQEVIIYAAHSKGKIKELHNKGIFDNIYQISKEDLYSLSLGSNINLKDGKCTPFYGNVKIENSRAAAKLEDMYFSLEQEKDSVYSVSEITNEKIYLTDIKEGGYFSIPKEAYPHFQVGNSVKKVDGKYTLI